MINLEICKKDNIDEVIGFVKKIDYEFPVRLSDLVIIDEYIKKLMDKGVIFVAKDEEKIIGICAGYINDIKNKKAYISLLGIDSKYRKLGIATKLIDLFIEKCKKECMKKIFLETHNENFSAIKFYIKNNFIILENVKANTEGCIILMRELI